MGHQDIASTTVSGTAGTVATIPITVAGSDGRAGATLEVATAARISITSASAAVCIATRGTPSAAANITTVAVGQTVWVDLRQYDVPSPNLAAVSAAPWTCDITLESGFRAVRPDDITQPLNGPRPRAITFASPTDDGAL
jgi:hypothetical protein